MYYLLISKYILSIKPDKQKTLKKKRKKNLGRKTSHKKFIHDIKAPILGTPNPMRPNPVPVMSIKRGLMFDI